MVEACSLSLLEHEEARDAFRLHPLMADLLTARGELDEALRIRQEEELPVYERLGDVRELRVGRANVAVMLLRLALEPARRMRVPEAGQIEEVMRAAGLEGEG